MQIISYISNYSVYHKFTVYLSNTCLFQAIKLSQIVLIQRLLFSISIVFVHPHLNVETVLFHAIHLSISTQFSSIKPIERTVSGATILGHVGPESDGNKEVLAFPKSLAFLEPHNQIVLCHIQDTC